MAKNTQDTQHGRSSDRRAGQAFQPPVETDTSPEAAQRAVSFEQGNPGDFLDTSGMPNAPRVTPTAFNHAPGGFDEVISPPSDSGAGSGASLHDTPPAAPPPVGLTVDAALRQYAKSPWVKAGMGFGAALLTFFVIYQLYLRFYTDIKTETTVISSYMETIDTEGIAIRDEILISGSVNDSSVSAVKNGAKVLKGQPVIHLFSSSQAAAAYERIEEIDREIGELESMVTASEDSANAVKTIDNLMAEQMALLGDCDGQSDLSHLSEIKSDVSYLLSKRLVAMRKIENYQDRIDALTLEKESLMSSGVQAPASINAPSSGYYVSSPDGYENLLNTSMLDELTAQQLDQIMSRKVSVPQTSAGKLLKNFTWYLACPVSAEDARDNLVVGTPYTLLLPYSRTGSMKATLTHLNEGDGKTLLAIFQCSSLLSELCEMRSQPVKIQIHAYKGFLVKKSALHVRVREKEEYDENGKLLYTYEDRHSCVYVNVSGQLYYRQIDILYNGDDFVICNANNEQGSGYLALYDEVVTEGKGLYAGKIID
ncbi:MAG: hypothetical protein II828_10320 [Clostridia bacterium]|nr:hypothetical protein [Clostridia bacterium]